jgi:NAD(P)-dependent dehydrogenase (short-subunit alcohol dehydrogenase family)
MQELNDRVAVITGAASGIGRGMAEAFAAAGMKIVLSDIDAEALHATTQALRDSGAEAHGVPADVSKYEQVEQLAAVTLRQYGAVHVLCNNAGVIGGSNPSWTSTPQDWQWVLGVNLMGAVHGIRAFLPTMIAQDTPAHIVNTASVAGLAVGGNSALYTVSKFGVVALSESLHLELLQFGLKPKVSVLCPGYVATNLMDAYRHRPGDMADISSPTSSPLAQALHEWLGGQLKQGLQPRAVGEQVLAAIRDERFYILTHADDWRSHIEHRMQNILTVTNPSSLPVPGTQSLLSTLAKNGVRLSRA